MAQDIAQYPVGNNITPMENHWLDIVYQHLILKIKILNPQNSTVSFPVLKSLSFIISKQGVKTG